MKCQRSVNLKPEWRKLLLVCSFNLSAFGRSAFRFRQKPNRLLRRGFARRKNCWIFADGRAAVIGPIDGKNIMAAAEKVSSELARSSGVARWQVLVLHPPWTITTGRWRGILDWATSRPRARVARQTRRACPSVGILLRAFKVGVRALTRLSSLRAGRFLLYALGHGTRQNRRTLSICPL